MNYEGMNKTLRHHQQTKNRSHENFTSQNVSEWLKKTPQYAPCTLCTFLWDQYCRYKTSFHQL